MSCVLKHFNNGNTIPMRSGSFSTMGTAFPRVPLRNDPWCGGKNFNDFSKKSTDRKASRAVSDYFLKLNVHTFKLAHIPLHCHPRILAGTFPLMSPPTQILVGIRSGIPFAKCAFCHAVPTVWNNLPQSVISDLTISLRTFKFRLKLNFTAGFSDTDLWSPRTCDSSPCEWLNVRYRPCNKKNNKNNGCYEVFSVVTACGVVCY